MSAILPGILNEAHAAEALWPEILQTRWAGIVGPQVAAHTRPGPLSAGTLDVYVDHSIWLSELKRYGQRQILDNIRRQLKPGSIERIRLLLDPDGSPPPAAHRWRGGRPPA